eukprot:gene20818-26986_t
MDLKGYHGQKKPLSLLCKDYSTISKYTSSLTDEKWVFKLFKDLLPGPYTIILPSSNEMPKQIIEKKNVKRWKRKEIGVRMPDDPVCSAILHALEWPLLGGSVPEVAEDVIGIILDLKNVMDEYEESDEDVVEDVKHIYVEENNFLDDLSACDWVNHVDFIIDNGKRGGIQSSSLSTIIDITSGQPNILRQGIGHFNPSNYI